ncbi:MAG: bis-aminopropyl spermidine synthase family protein [Myxococcales bacterium]|nr:bis-aminopropyl spermidine synthase family protein [Myxococcales bacterium]
MSARHYQLTRHLVLRPRARADRLAAENLAQKTTLELTLDEWHQLAPFGPAPRALDEGAAAQPESLVSRAIAAKILVTNPERIDIEMATGQLRLELGQLLQLSTCLPRPEFDEYVRVAAAGRGKFVGLFELGKTFYAALNRIRFENAVVLLQPWYIGILQRYIIGLFDHLLAFYAQVNATPQEPYEIDPELCLDAMRRPPEDVGLNQLPIMPVSTVARANLVAKVVPQNARLLVLGDDDLMSLAIGPRRPDLEIHVAEVDERLLAVLRAGKERRKLDNVTFHTVDLRDGLPDEMCEAFDAVITDPPYNTGGMTAFIVTARQAMKRGTAKPARLLLSTNPDLVVDGPQFFKDLQENQFMIMRRRRHFNQYPTILRFLTHELPQFMEMYGYPLKAVKQFLACPYYYSDLFECFFVEDVRTHARISFLSSGTLGGAGLGRR